MTISIDNATADFPAILKDHDIRIAENMTCFCPFHEDERHRSGKLFLDGDGWRLYCWVCGQQFRPSDFYRKLKRDGMIDEEIVVIGNENDEEFKALDTAFLAPFKRGEIGIEDVCRLIFERKREVKDRGEHVAQAGIGQEL